MTIDSGITGGGYPFTFGPPASIPGWSVSGGEIMFSSDRRIYRKTAAGEGNPELVLEASACDNPDDLSPDGKYLVCSAIDPKTNRDIVLVPLAGERTPARFAASPADETQAQVSPGGKWIAYVSNESGRQEVYVQSFPTPGGKRQVSANGGAQVTWRQDGKEVSPQTASAFSSIPRHEKSKARPSVSSSIGPRC